MKTEQTKTHLQNKLQRTERIERKCLMNKNQHTNMKANIWQVNHGRGEGERCNSNEATDRVYNPFN